MDGRRAVAMKPLLSCLAAALSVALLIPSPGAAQSGPDQTGPFLGVWCAQGNPSSRASIAANGPFNVNLTNENGSTSIGMISGMSSRQITAPEWNLVQGTLSADGRTISWSNNTYWTRCPRTYVNVQGTWYVGGDQSRPCHINQRSGNVSLRNETGQTGNGSFTSSNQIATTWSGTPISGTISSDQNRIDWSNGTYWTR
jgi:hypothetical protein